MEAEISQGRPKALPATQNASQKSSGGGQKLGSWGTKFKFVQLIIMKIIKTVVTRCHILRLKCTKFDFGWGSAQDPAGGAHGASPDPQLDLRGLTSNRRGGRGREKGRGGGRKGEGEKGGEGVCVREGGHPEISRRL